MRVNTPAAVAGEYAAREASFTPALRDAGPITGELALVDDSDGAFGTTFDACQALTNSDQVGGKIAFLQRGDCDFEDKLKNAEAAGAIAAIVFNNQAELIIMSGTRDSVRIPAQMIGQADGQLLLDRLRGAIGPGRNDGGRGRDGRHGDEKAAHVGNLAFRIVL